MGKSIDRVADDARAKGLTIAIRRMGQSTRTAEEAARECECAVGQIVKSLVFEGVESGRLYLFLLSGANQLDLDKAAALAGEALQRSDPRRVRDETGFAIGGVSPLGHLVDIPRFGDETLLGFDLIWAAAGAHDAVFSANPKALFEAANAVPAKLAQAS